jgi:hypothetical protein
MRTLHIAAISVIAANVAVAAPSIDVDFSGLGHSTVATIVSQHWSGNPERFLPAALAGTFDLQNTGVQSLRDAGFRCGDEVSTCSYEGYLTFHLNGLPKENAGRAFGRVDFSIAISNSMPPQFAVQVKRSDGAPL